MKKKKHHERAREEHETEDQVKKVCAENAATSPMARHMEGGGADMCGELSIDTSKKAEELSGWLFACRLACSLTLLARVS